MILALAGRRIDAMDAKPPRFPLQNVDRVREAVHRLLVQEGATAVVSSAACGADLIALVEAGKLGLRRRVVLPFTREKFRESSVVDRPGEWGGLYDAVLNEVDAMGDLVLVGGLDKADAHTTASRLILGQAIALGQERREAVGAVMIWDGASRGTKDYTAEFGGEARKRGLPVFEIVTVLGCPREVM